MPRIHPRIVLLFAVVGLSLAAPLIRLSHAPALALITWRLIFSCALIGVILLVTGQWRQWRGLSARDVGIAAVGGALLAVHFWSWTASLSLTTVAASVVLVTLQPVFVALLSTRLLGEAPSRRQWMGIGIALAGALLVASHDASSSGGGSSRAALVGDALAILGAISAAIYFVIGRRLRQSMDLFPYIGLVYGSCLVVLIAIGGARHVALWPQPPRELAIFGALALGPMMLGHTGLNWAMRYLPAYVVNLTTLGEPVGATLLAAVIPGIREIPGWGVVAGGALVLCGVLTSLSKSRTVPIDP